MCDEPVWLAQVEIGGGRVGGAGPSNLLINYLVVAYWMILAQLLFLSLTYPSNYYYVNKEN